MHYVHGEPRIEGRPGESMVALDFDQWKKDLEEKHYLPTNAWDVMGSMLYPKVYDDYIKHKKTYGDISILETRHVFYPLCMSIII